MSEITILALPCGVEVEICTDEETAEARLDLGKIAYGPLAIVVLRAILDTFPGARVERVVRT